MYEIATQCRLLHAICQPPGRQSRWQSTSPAALFEHDSLLLQRGGLLVFFTGFGVAVEGAKNFGAFAVGFGILAILSKT